VCGRKCSLVSPPKTRLQDSPLYIDGVSNLIYCKWRRSHAPEEYTRELGVSFLKLFVLRDAVLLDVCLVIVDVVVDVVVFVFKLVGIYFCTGGAGG